MTTTLPRGATSLHREPADTDDGAYDWDPSRPLAEQWPWNGEANAPETAPQVEAPDISAGYAGQGNCEGCGNPIRDGEDVYVWEDDIVSHVDCAGSNDAVSDESDPASGQP